MEWKGGNLGRYESFIEDVTCGIVGAEYHCQTTLSVISATVLTHVTPIAMNHVKFVNPRAMNAVKTAQIHTSWYEDIGRIDSAQRN